MKVVKTCLLTLIFLWLVSFSYAQKKKIDNNNNINKIISVYLEIKNALIMNDGSTAKIRSKQLYNLFATEPDRSLTRKQAKLVAQSLEPLLDNSREMSYTIVENDQRGYFAILSKTLYDLLKALKLNTSTIYLQYSPANKSYWISESKEIKNPYYNFYNKPMSTIGTTSEILAANK